MNIAGLIAGILFGLGLVISGMADPAKIQNFLDIAGTWDPSLIFVMGGAIAVTLPGFAILKGRDHPLFAEAFQFPTRSDIDAPLVTGAAVFGLGWGLTGYCPGPALTSLPMAAPGTLIFVPAMLVGMMAARMRAKARPATAT